MEIEKAQLLNETKNSFFSKIKTIIHSNFHYIALFEIYYPF